MACAAYRDAIAEHVDGTLDSSRVAALERHLESCAACAALISDLRRITAAAPSLATLTPPPSLGARIAATAGAERTEGSRRARLHRRLAIAASLLLVVSIGLFLFRGGRAPMLGSSSTPGATALSGPTAGSVERTEDPARLVQSIEEELRLAAEHYERAIVGLEQAARADQQVLDPLTASTLQRNLSVIDQAIEESRAALRLQPASQPARESLFEAFKNKVTLLQETVALINEMRKGDDAGTARMIGELAK
jgi:anti-sigma factor RsiW